MFLLYDVKVASMTKKLTKGETIMKKETVIKKSAKVISKTLESVLRVEANTTSCILVGQPKAPKELCRFKKSK